jgi:ribonuclease-3
MKDFSILEKKLGLKFKNKDLLEQAFTHRSYLNENPSSKLQHNERLEFLGDSVLSLIIANYLFHKYPDQDEGFLTRVKTKLVNGVQLSKLARQINLGKYILMSNHVQNIKGRNSQKILEDAFEALLAAIFKDLGFDAVDSFVTNLIETLDFTEVLFEDNYKDILLKYSQKVYNTTPEYPLLSTEGPPHNRMFQVKVTINNKDFSTGWGKSKKQAEQVAAEQTLKSFKI